MAIAFKLAQGLPAPATIMKALASPILTVVFFLATAASALTVKAGWATPTEALLVPFGLLVLNLGAAIGCNPRFRTDLPLLLFHLALLALISLFVAGRLTYLYGSISVTRGTTFNGIVDKLEQGPLHGERFRDLRFVHGGLVERFKDDVGHHVEIRSRLRWQDAHQQWQETELRFGYPLILNGYRIYPSGRRGFSPVFHWQATNGQQDVGTVQLFGPDEQVDENSNSWVLPNGVKAWLQLEKFAPQPPPFGSVRTDLDAAQVPHKLILRIGDERHELKLGDSVQVPGGQLRYLRLESWAGYSLIYDPTEYWLIATILMALASLGWFYVRQFRRRPLDDGPP